MAWRKKNKKDVPVVRMTDEELESVEQSAAELAKTQLPLGRVKKLIRMNPDVEMVNAEALQMMTKAAEMFVKELSNAANYHAALEKRKTVQAKDIDKAIKKTWQFAFLEDALDGWPKMEPKKRNKAGTNGEEDTQNTQEDTIAEDVEPTDSHNDNADNNEEEEEELPETVPESDEFVEKDDEEIVRRDTFAEQF